LKHLFERHEGWGPVARCAKRGLRGWHLAMGAVLGAASMPACRISAAAAAAYAFWAAPNNARPHMSPSGAANLIPNKRRYIDPPGMAAL